MKTTLQKSGDAVYFYSYYDSPLGRLTVAGDEKNIVGLWIENQKYYMHILRDNEYQEKETAVIRLAKDWLDRYFRGEKPWGNELPIKFIGSDFRVKVWYHLTEIPYGKVITYGDIAKKLATEKGIKVMSAQAVGGAVGHNPISIIVPCHRVIGAKGNIIGYSAGTDIKKRLLEFEGAEI